MSRVKIGAVAKAVLDIAAAHSSESETESESESESLDSSEEYIPGPPGGGVDDLYETESSDDDDDAAPDEDTVPLPAPPVVPTADVPQSTVKDTKNFPIQRSMDAW